MTLYEITYGQSALSAQIVFNSICKHLLLRTKGIHLKKLLNTLCDPQSDSDLVNLLSQQSVISHADVASRMLFIEASAFLTDEQKEELQKLRSELSKDWQIILLNLALPDPESTQAALLRKIDAVFLCQLEWMRDVEFEKCSEETRRKLIYESPLADVMTKD